MRFINQENGETIDVWWNHERDSLLYQRKDKDGKEIESDHFGISTEEFDKKFKGFRRDV